jgi:hypothetical protein
MTTEANQDRTPSETPKVFISYSWSSPAHQEEIYQYARRLRADHVEVVFDLLELKEGQDKNAFMEKMVTDPSVTHVLVFSDAEYARKADARKQGGVGTESQIISQEVYGKVDQTKFIPIFCELDANGQPCLPVFFRSRFGIDFSTPAKVEENWERLVRLLHGKPLYEKPPMKAIFPSLIVGVLNAGCSTGKHQSGNLARVIAGNLREYSADLPHINLEQPAIGIDQMYTSWRWEGDPGGFRLTFKDGKYDGVLYQMKQIAGNPLPAIDGEVHIWQVEGVAHLDLVRLPSGKTQLTCRRLPIHPVVAINDEIAD